MVLFFYTKHIFSLIVGLNMTWAKKGLNFLHAKCNSEFFNVPFFTTLHFGLQLNKKEYSFLGGMKYDSDMFLTGFVRFSQLETV